MARPDQLYGEEECSHPWCELEVPLGVCRLSRLLRLFQNKVIRTGPYAKWKELPHNDKTSGLCCYCTVVYKFGEIKELATDFDTVSVEIWRLATCKIGPKMGGDVIMIVTT